MEEEKELCKEDIETVEFKHLFVLAGVVVAIMAGVLWISPNYFEGDPEALYRYTFLKLPYTAINVVLLLMGVCFCDYVTPRAGLDSLGKDPMSNALFFSAFTISLAIVMAFS